MNGSIENCKYIVLIGSTCFVFLNAVILDKILNYGNRCNVKTGAMTSNDPLQDCR